MSEVKWVKITTDMFDNRKIKHLRRLPDGNCLALIWIMLLTAAGRCNAGGRIFLTESIPYTAEMLAAEFDFSEALVAEALRIFEQLNMIRTENGFLQIAGWEEYQNTDRLAEIREYNRLAKQRSRAKKSQNTAVNDVSMTGQRCHGTEEEGEEDKEKEFHSFYHSAPPEEEIFIEKKVAEAGFEGKDAEIYRAELRENIRLKYLGGELGQDVVLMSGEQFDDLCSKLSLDELEKYFAIVAECEKNGKRYKRKSHYQAILDMASRDRHIQSS